MRFIAFLVMAMTLPAVAQAHAFLDHASPRVGSTVSPAPKQIVLWFTEAPEPRFSNIEVLDDKGKPMQTGKASIAGERATLRVALKALPPGIYTVRWHVVSVDTHRTEGSFTFTVGR